MTDKAPTKRQFRHGARTYEQESNRDTEMNRAVKAAERDAPSEFEGAARAAARKILREQWAVEDAERDSQAPPLPPHISRLEPGELDADTLQYLRRPYLAALQLLDPREREREVQRLMRELTLEIEIVR
ncbi:hypothetical protein [Bradyrhizobium sp. 604_D8_N2_3]|uniref:hypothetical protein n=1 Tax=Bradyrhizobium sp. 604_D8_N2_3 TaxID=3240370 RepID=UPI003F273B14